MQPHCLVNHALPFPFPLSSLVTQDYNITN
jgi:hypothetical protein